MQGLYYPAILGSGIVLIMIRISRGHGWTTDISVYFAVIFSLFFSLSFLINEHTSDKDYGIAAFIIDIVETILVFLAFYFLGFLLWTAMTHTILD
jgi:hypothetical protein